MAACIPIPPGAVAWWPGDGDAVDVVGGHNGTLRNGAHYTNGFVGLTFAFDGEDDYVEVPDHPELRLTNELTIEFWAKRREFESDFVIAKGDDWTRYEQNYGVNLAQASKDYWFIFTCAGGWRGATGVSDTQWHHYAVVARNGEANPTFYIDGVVQHIVAGGGMSQLWLNPSTRPLTIGAQIDWSYYGKNLIDELGLYNRALSPTEIRSIYEAGSGGKCKPFRILREPEDQLLDCGGSVTFAVNATNELGDVSYQWQFEQEDIPNATNAVLTLTNLVAGQVGTYTVLVQAIPQNAILAASAELRYCHMELNRYAGLTIFGTVGSRLTIQYRNRFDPQAQWTPLTNVTVSANPFLFIDLSSPKVSQRFYRAISEDCPPGTVQDDHVFQSP